jgi:hypothetical protein
MAIAVSWTDPAIAIGTLVAALAALCAAGIAVWIARWSDGRAVERLKEERKAADQRLERSYTLPLLSEIFAEFRTEAFRDGMSFLETKTPKPAPNNGFRGTSKVWQHHAYRVCYFFDYIGTLVHREIVQEELVISLLGNPALRVWAEIEDIVDKEREFRIKNFLHGSKHGFLRYYEDFVCRILDQYEKSPIELRALSPGWRETFKPED